MVIDNDKNHILTNYKAARKNGKAVDSDHYTLYLDLELEIKKEKPERHEIYNFKNKECQELFKINTTETSDFTECFDGDSPLVEKIEKWRKVLEKHCSKAFRKIRIKDKKTRPLSKKIATLINKRNSLTRIGCICNEKIINQSNVQNHPWRHGEKPKFNCKECNKCFGERRRLYLHEGKHRNLKCVCEECGKQCNGRVSLKLHAKQHSRKTKKQYFNRKTILKMKKSMVTERKLFQCTYCDKTFLLKKGFRNHLRIHRGTQQNRCENCDNKISLIDIEIAEEEAAENRGKILKQFNFSSENCENLDMQKMWKTLKNICPKMKQILPSAKKNHQGKIISSKNDVKKLLEKEFKNRLRERPYRDDLISTKQRRNRLFEEKLKFSEKNKRQPWTMEDLEIALRDLKRNKSRDFEGLVNEIFKTDVIGCDLKKMKVLYQSS